MPYEFSLFELAVTAVLIDRRLAQRDPRTALANARDLLDRAREFQNASAASEGGFLEAVEAGIPADLGGQKDRTGYRSEVQKVSEGGQSDRVLVLDRNGVRSSFDEYLMKRAVPIKLQRRKFSGHWKKFEKHKIDYYGC